MLSICSSAVPLGNVNNCVILWISYDLILKKSDYFIQFFYVFLKATVYLLTAFIFTWSNYPGQIHSIVNETFIPCGPLAQLVRALS